MMITEALAQIKLNEKKVAQKRQTIRNYLFRQEQIRDPLEKEGGSQKFIAEEQQAVNDLEERIVAIRRAVQEANSEVTLTICGKTRTIADWLVWRREVAGHREQHLSVLRSDIMRAREQATRKGVGVVHDVGEAKEGDLVVNVSEKKLAEEIEEMTEILETLDGQLSLLNATTPIELED